MCSGLCGVHSLALCRGGRVDHRASAREAGREDSCSVRRAHRVATESLSVQGKQKCDENRDIDRVWFILMDGQTFLFLGVYFSVF